MTKSQIVDSFYATRKEVEEKCQDVLSELNTAAQSKAANRRARKALTELTKLGKDYRKIAVQYDNAK